MNVIVIVADTWRFDYLGCYDPGNRHSDQPNANGFVYAICFGKLPAQRMVFLLRIHHGFSRGIHPDRCGHGALPQVGNETKVIG